ncbi:MAG TPA: NAD-dependent deacylase [Chitinophagales bacterium]|nr:NAD-dependent deacylase [Chitinophagales bacterium]
MNKKKIVILTGAGMSAESGIQTFRDSDGLWENHRIEDVATPEAFARNPKLVHDFYNLRRKQLNECQPNLAHIELTKLEQDFDVTIITQNVDDLHERAGSSKVIHLHGELKKIRSTKNPDIILEWDQDLSIEDRGPDGHPLRPHIVWFGEAVPKMDIAIDITRRADIFIVIGTSLQVYPAASLAEFLDYDVPRYLIDPGADGINTFSFEVIREKATIGVPLLVNKLMNG